jgi:hypothetical protein
MIFRKTLTYGVAVGLSFGALGGCGRETVDDKVESGKHYFAEIPMSEGIALTSADFDGDGDIDFVVGSRRSGTCRGRLYYFENDGKGNFTLRKSERR